MKPLAFDICAGLGGWTDGFLAEGWTVIGIDIERRPYPAQLWLQDIRTIHGSQLRHADAIVASPPCQEYSYMAMPWKRGKAIAAAIRADDDFSQRVLGHRGPSFIKLTELFNACFRIQREASEAAGRYIPMVVENVKGAQPWVGKSRANFGSFHLWGDVDSIGGRIVRRGDIRWGVPSVKAAKRGVKVPQHIAQVFKPGDDGLKLPGNGNARRWEDRTEARLSRGNGDPVSAERACIPLTLAQHIATVFKP